jgi:hypothetical protein
MAPYKESVPASSAPAKMASKIHMEKPPASHRSRHENEIYGTTPSIAVFWTIPVATAEMKTARLRTGAALHVCC